MVFNFNIKTRLLIAGILIVLGVFVILHGFILEQEDIPLAHGSSSDNLRGWGWSEGVGWISMNCYNDYDDDGDFEDCCPGGDAAFCASYGGLAGGDYGVNFDTNNNKLSGWAWSEGAGWICFGETCTPPGKCTGGGNDGTTCTTDANCTQGGVCWKEICAGGDNDGAVCTTEADCPGGICQNRSPHGRTQWACVGMPSWPGGTLTCSGDAGEGFNNTANLVSQWEMNDAITDGETCDFDCVGTNHGSLKPTPPSDAPKQVKGKYNKALSFDGTNDYVEVGDSGDLSITGDLTVEAWVKRGAIETEQTIAGKWDESGAFRSYRLWFDTNNNLNFSVSSDGTAVTTVTQAPKCVAGSDPEEQVACTVDADCAGSGVCKNKPITDVRKWHHVAGKYIADSSLKIFIDGELAGVQPTGVPASLQDLSQKLYFGAHKGASVMGDYFNGVIDNVSVWNRAKTGNEMFDDAHMEISGWAKAVSSKEGGWLSLRGYTRGDKVWGSYLKDYLGFYTLGGFMGERSNNERMSTTNLVGHWKFNEHEDAWDGVGTDAIDGSGSNNHGTAQGGATTIDKGIFARAGDFDGGVCIGGSNPGTACTSNAQCTGGGSCGNGDHISVADSATLDITDEMSISLWFRADSSSGAELICKSVSDTDESLRLYVDPSTNKVYFDYGDASQYAETTAFTINTSEWYHVVGTVSADNPGKIYINGQEASTYTAQENAPSTLLTNNNPLEIGGCTFVPRYFDGMIDNVAIYNNGLFPSQINTMYEQRKPYSMGWGDFDDDPPAPLAFNTLSLDSSVSCSQLLVQWEPSDWADSYSYWRKLGASSSDCNACNSDDSTCTGYTEYSYLDTCGAGCAWSDTGLTDNTGYCYSVEAHNETGDIFITNNSPTYPAPQWESTTLCPISIGPGTEASVDTSICGQLTIIWDPVNDADGYNTYRDLDGTTCATGVNTRVSETVSCEAVSHIGEALDYDADNNGTTDLVGHWRFNESAGISTVDSSGSNNTGTATDAIAANDSDVPPPTVTGLFSNARSFDGLDDYIDLPNILDPSATAFTAELWFKPNDYSLKTEDQYILAQEDDTTTGTGGQAWLLIKNATNDAVASNLGNASTDSGVAPTAGEWHHGAVTKSGTTIKTYIDGELKQTGTQTTEASDGRLRIGLGKGNTNAFDGVIDGVAIYNTAKSPEQIRVDYEAGSCKVCSGGTNDGGICSTNSDCPGGGTCDTSTDCGLDVVCHVSGVDTNCGKAIGDANACCFTDRRIIPFVDYYYVISVTSEAGESLGSSTFKICSGGITDAGVAGGVCTNNAECPDGETCIAPQTSCYPAPEAGEE